MTQDEYVKYLHATIYEVTDHGNAEKKFDYNTGQPSKSHTTNPVYFIEVKKGLEHTSLSSTMVGLADIAPLLLKNMGLALPKEMKR